MEIVYFYYEKVSKLKQTPQVIPTYDYQHMIEPVDYRSSIKKPRQEEIVYDDQGFQRIKQVSIESPDQSFPNKDMAITKTKDPKRGSNITKKRKSDILTNAKTPNFKNFYPDSLEIKKTSSEGGIEKGKNPKAFQKLFEPMTSPDEKEIKLLLRSKTCNQILMPLSSVPLKSSTQPQLSPEINNEKLENLTPNSQNEVRSSRISDRKRSNVLLNNKLLKESPKVMEPRQFNYEFLQQSGVDKQFNDFISAKLSHCSPRASQNNSKLESPLLPSGIILLSSQQ